MPAAAGDRHDKGRVLFVMQYPGYLRYYDSVVQLLADRGHKVIIGFDSPHKQPEGNKALESMPDRVRTLPSNVPNRSDFWWPLARALRGTIDYARYLHPHYHDAPYLRTRMAKVLPAASQWLVGIRSLPPAVLRVFVRALEACDAAIPSSRRLDKFIAHIRPDVVIVTPLVTDCSPQVDVIKSAHRLGIPAIAGIASWDHLTTKGLMRIRPDRVILWNETQREEAQKFHGVPAARITVTGANPFDRWFGRQPARDRATFCRRVGLSDESPFVLFLGSTKSISAPRMELEFVRKWLHAIRSADDPVIRDVPVLIRPHPYNSDHWRDVDVSPFGRVAIWPRHSANPVDEGDRDDYFDSLYHCAVGVGVNTSAMIEAAIVGRVVHTVLAPEFGETQSGTLHFRYLTAENGGCLRVGRTLDEHVMQLAETLQRPAEWQERLQAFVRHFVRPNGLDVAATPLVVDAVEQVMQAGRTPSGVGVARYPLTAIMWIVASIMLMADPPRFRQTIGRLKARVTARNAARDTPAKSKAR